MKPKLIRITTVPMSLKILLKGQLHYMNQYFEVVGVSSPGKELREVEESEGVRTVEVDMSREITPLKDLLSLVKMIRVLSQEKPQIVHTHTPKAGIIGMLAAWICRVPHRLHTVAGLPVMESIGVKRSILMAVERLTYKCATHVYPNSKGLEAFILDNRLTTQDKTKVLANGSSNGIDTTYFKRIQAVLQESQSVKETYGIHDGDFVYIFVGRIVRDKGINELLQAFDAISKTNLQTKLMLVGSFEENLDPIAENTKEILENNRQIIQTGFQKDVRPFLAASDCLVFPSYREGFPNVIMQAGAMGLPAIVSDINGCNEIIKEGINGLVIPPKDTTALKQAMDTICHDDALRERLAGNARRQIVEQYDQKYVWQSIKAEYDKLLNASGE